jgi:hypothetical protein
MIVDSIRNIISINRYDIAEVKTYRTLVDEVTGKRVLASEYHYYKLYTHHGTMETPHDRGSAIDIKV